MRMVIKSMRQNIKSMRKIVKSMREDLKSMREDLKSMREDLKSMRKVFQVNAQGQRAKIKLDTQGHGPKFESNAKMSFWSLEETENCLVLTDSWTSKTSCIDYKNVELDNRYEDSDI